MFYIICQHQSEQRESRQPQGGIKNVAGVCRVERQQRTGSKATVIAKPGRVSEKHYVFL